MTDRSPLGGLERTAIDALLFDLGNVVIEIDFDRVFESWARDAGTSPSAIKRRFSFDDAYERHERGEIDVSQYFASLRDTLRIDLLDEQFLDGWNSLFVDEVAGMRELLGRAREHFPLFAFTNTNAAHHAEWSSRFASACAPIGEIFLSSDLGLRKPDVAAFEAVARAMGVPEERILFFDDSAQNVSGARKARLQAVHVTSLADVDAALRPLMDRRADS